MRTGLLGMALIALGSVTACGDVVVPETSDGSVNDLGKADGGDSTGGESCEFGAADQCDDGNSCTVDECLSTNVCQHTARTNVCKIEGTCYDAGEASPTSGCWICDPTNGLTNWSLKDCSDLDTECESAGCDVETGECKLQLEIGKACDDGDACTVDDACGADGACAGSVDITIEGCGCDTEADCDDGLDCTTDSCDAGLCAHEATAGSCYIDGACYEDGAPNPDNACQLCVVDEAIDAWSAQQCDDGTPCTDESCDPEAGCVYVDNDAASCDDGDPCSEDDHCDGGVCVGSCGCTTEADCTGDTAACQKWACIDYACVEVADESLDGQGCDDGQYCTEGETCTAGVCGGATERDCSAEGDGACLVGQCNEDTDACEGVAAEAGTSCDDGDACTDGDACDGTTCAGVAKDCTGLDDQCNIGECVAGTCEAVPQDGVSCDDDDTCTLGDTCTPTGQCKGAWDELNCGCASDATCTSLTDTCNTGKCDVSANQCYADPNVGAGCNDNNACTYDDACTADGGCAGTAYTCTAPLSCQVSVCDGNGGCDVTTSPGFCVIGGACYANGAENPNNPCQVCNTGQSTTSWSNATNGKSCNADNNGCTADDSCSNGACQAGAAVVCDSDNKSCTDDVCQSLSSTGYTCNYTANGNGCHIGGACYAAGAENPSNPCQQCTPATNKSAWTAKSNGSACDDGKYCTANDSCQSGSCTGSGNPCDDGLSCTSNNCNESTDKCSYPVSSGCLIGGKCYAEGAANPNNACQACLSGTSTSAFSNNDGAKCSDGNGCTTGDTCSGGQCNGGLTVSCNDSDPCTTDTCSSTGSSTYKCLYTDKPAGASCGLNACCSSFGTCGSAYCDSGGCGKSEACCTFKKGSTFCSCEPVSFNGTCSDVGMFPCFDCGGITPK